MTARESYNKAVINYNNAIKDAQLQNNAALAEIAYNALQKQLELSLQGFQYKNDLVIQQANKKLEIDNVYYNRYMDVLDQINKENEVKKDIWKYKDTQKWQTEQAQIDRDFEAGENEKRRTFEAEEARIDREFKAKQAEIDRKHDKEMLEAETKADKEKIELQHKNDLAKLEKQKQNELAIMAQELANDKSLASYTNSLKSTSSSSKSGGSSGGSVKISSGSGTKKTAITTNNKTSTGTSLKVNTASVMALGYGAISSSKLASLVNSGQVRQYTKNGQIYFEKTPLNNYKYRFGR